MKTFLRIFSFARPIEKYAVPYVICVILYAIFNALNFGLIIPLVGTLFNQDSMTVAVTALPDFEMSSEYLDLFIRHMIYLCFGDNYTIHDVLVMLSFIIIGSVFLSNVFRFISQKIMENLRIHTLQTMRDKMFENIMNLNVRFFSNEKKGDILSKLTSDINTVQYCVTNTLQVVFREPALLIGYFILLITISGKLTLFVLAILPFTAIIIGFIVKKLRRSAREAQESLSDMVSIAEESLSGIKVVKSYNVVDYVVGKFKSKDGIYSSILRSMATRQQMASPMSEFLGVSAVSIILIYGGGMVIAGDISAEAFLTYLAAFSQVTRPARSITDSFSTIHQGLAAGERVMELIDAKPEILDRENPVIFEGVRDKIEFKNVCFSYENKEILHNINFTINKGETVAIVGASGGGKSTIADLIPRFYDVNNGEILFDGKDVRDYKMSSIRERIGLVSQDVVLFNDSIEQNILLGKIDASHEDVVSAAKIANAHQFILQSEQGYETNIGDRGVKLSGGQRQRLSIARAVLKNPEILILDEATSALDTESEKLVQDALNNLLKDRTSLIIAHRLSTIQHADRIVVVEKGQIIEQGTHTELMDKKGVYHKLIELQNI